MENQRDAHNQTHQSNIKATTPTPKWTHNTYRKRKRPVQKAPTPAKDKSLECPTTNNKATCNRKSSWVWDHFTKYEEDGNPRATCNYCGQDYAAHSKVHGTDNMSNHLEFQCKKYPYRSITDDKQKTLAFGTKKEIDGRTCVTIRNVGYNYEECRASLVAMIIIDELPFKIVENEGFRRYSACLQPKFALPSRVTVARDCMKLFYDEKKKLKHLMKSERVCITMDMWTSIQNMNYMCLTAHWIDKDWRLLTELSFLLHQDKFIVLTLVTNCRKGLALGKRVIS